MRRVNSQVVIRNTWDYGEKGPTSMLNILNPLAINHVCPVPR